VSEGHDAEQGKDVSEQRHSPPKECRQMGMSGCRKSLSEQGEDREVSTRKGFEGAKSTHHLKSMNVRTWKESDRVMVTRILANVDREASQDKETTWPSKGHLPSQ
jgi:hypothetical protein